MFTPTNTTWRLGSDVPVIVCNSCFVNGHVEEVRIVSLIQ